jgi:hypothetical protein
MDGGTEALEKAKEGGGEEEEDMEGEESSEEERADEDIFFLFLLERLFILAEKYDENEGQGLEAAADE